MLKTILPAVLLVLCSVSAFAQRDARVQLQLGNWSSPNASNGVSNFSPRLNALGISAEHRIFKNLFIKAAYQRWIMFSSFAPVSTTPDFYDKNAPDMEAPSSIGHIYERDNYSMIDITANYLFALGKSELYAGAGISNAIGTNYTLKSYYFGGGFAEGGCIMDIEYTEVKKHYLGAAFEAGYNYHIAKERLNIGTSFSGRYYNADFVQYTLNINLGYNFSFSKKKISTSVNN